MQNWLLEYLLETGFLKKLINYNLFGWINQTSTNKEKNKLHVFCQVGFKWLEGVKFAFHRRFFISVCFIFFLIPYFSYTSHGVYLLLCYFESLFLKFIFSLSAHSSKSWKLFSDPPFWLAIAFQSFVISDLHCFCNWAGLYGGLLGQTAPISLL